MELKVESSEDMSDLNAKYSKSKVKQMQNVKIDKLLARCKARTFSIKCSAPLNHAVD